MRAAGPSPEILTAQRRYWEVWILCRTEQGWRHSTPLVIVLSAKRSFLTLESHKQTPSIGYQSGGLFFFIAVIDRQLNSEIFKIQLHNL
jgi:hypothetical protein